MAKVAVIGGGPAGLIAAENLAHTGHAVTVFDRMPSAGRKFLLAGRGGLNLTHAEDVEALITRYGAASVWMEAAIRGYPPDRLRAWCEALGQPVFDGTSGRVFPVSFKATPLLRAWLGRLEAMGVRFVGRHRWLGWTQDGALAFEAAGSVLHVQADAVLLALGGGSWPRMGSDGSWVDLVRARGVQVAPLRASNCGVSVAWSSVFFTRFEGQPLKRIALSMDGHQSRGELVVTRDGLEGGAAYALSAPIRARLDAGQPAVLRADLRPDLDLHVLSARIGDVGRGRSLSNLLRQSAGLSPVAIGLVQEAVHTGQARADLAALIKNVAITVTGMQPIERAISSAGGISLTELDDHLMLRQLPGVFVAGEMLDWEAPTGGYLLQGCFSTGVRAAHGLAEWVRGQRFSATASR